MARRNTDPKPVVISLDGFPGAAVYRIDRDMHYPMYLGQIVGSAAYPTASQAEAPAIAAWVSAHPETHQE